jgi:miniconductance mechanosensitive channel
MTPEMIQSFLERYPRLGPWAVAAAVLAASVLVFWVVRTVIGRGLGYLARRTASKYDDLVVAELHPYRFSWIAPLLVIYYFATAWPEATTIIRQVVLVLVLWLAVLTINSLLNAVNTIYEASPYYRGEPIQGYLDLGKIALVLAAIILTISLFTGRSPLLLLGGLGAAMAVLLLVFQDTLLSFVASIQIQSSDLVKEGDWIEVPSYGADGEVVNMALHMITIQNWDKSLTTIPTHKLLQEPSKNWRRMQEGIGRRFKRSIYIDLNSITFCEEAMIERLRQIELLADFISSRMAEIEEWNRLHGATADNPFEGRQLSNLEAYRAYMNAYLRSRSDLHQEGMALLAHQLDPGPTGMPLEVVGFTKTVDWAEYEAIQAEIVDHLLSTMPLFGLRVFQQPTGLDFRMGLAGRAN